MPHAALFPPLVDTIHFLHARGWAPATSSNYSCREEGEANFWISQSGVDKGTFAPHHLMQVDAAGNPVNDSRNPSAETLLHCLIYQRSPHTHCVLHTHTVNNTALSYAEAARGKVVFEGFELNKALRGITTHESAIEVPIFANSQDMVALSAEIDAYWATHPDMRAFLLAGHGVYTWGTTIAETKRHIEALEFLFDTLLTLKRYGYPYHS